MTSADLIKFKKMISYEIAQQQPKPSSQKNSILNSSRVRVLGIIEDKRCILFSIATSKTTEIQLYNQYGISTTVIAFNKYMDIVAADISFDMEMILYTERIILSSSTNCIKCSKMNHLFKYESVLCSINSFSKLQVFDDFNPISSYFLPYVDDNKFTGNFNFYKTSNQDYNDIKNQKLSDNEYELMLQSKKEDSSKSYQFIHVIGDKVSHFRATFKKQKIHVRMIHNGINMNKCQKWVFSKQDLAFYSFNEGKFTAFNILNDSKRGPSINVDIHPYLSDPSSILPHELALKPSTLTNLPYFRFSSGISYIVKINNNGKTDYGIIEQLYKGDDSFLSFTVATVCSNFKNTITVRGVQPDLPISFLSPGNNRNVVFVFIPNSFVTFVDFSFPTPHISMMPHIFCEALSVSQLVSTIDGSTNLIIDLRNGKIYESFIKIPSFPKSLHYTDRMILSIIAHLIATFPDQVSISSAIENLPSDISYIQFFFKSIFSVINQLMPTKSADNDPIRSLPHHFDVPRTKSDSTKNVYNNKLIKRQFPHCNSSFNLRTNDNKFHKVELMVPDDSINAMSSSSTSSVFSDKSMSESNKSLSLNHSKSFSELTKMIVQKADFIRLIYDNIEYLFKSGIMSEQSIFLIEAVAAFEAIYAKMPESLVFATPCSERALRFCPFIIRQSLAINSLIFYPHKRMNQEINYLHVKKYDNGKNQKAEKKNILIDNIVKNQSKERDQILYWKKKFSFLKKDENFFQSNNSSPLKKRTKSNVHISINNFNQNAKNSKVANNKEFLLEQILAKESDENENLNMKVVSYISRRCSSLNAHRSLFMKYAHS